MKLLLNVLPSVIVIMFSSPVFANKSSCGLFFLQQKKLSYSINYSALKGHTEKVDEVVLEFNSLKKTYNTLNEHLVQIEALSLLLGREQYIDIIKYSTKILMELERQTEISALDLTFASLVAELQAKPAELTAESVQAFLNSSEVRKIKNSNYLNNIALEILTNYKIILQKMGELDKLEDVVAAIQNNLTIKYEKDKAFTDEKLEDLIVAEVNEVEYERVDDLIFNEIKESTRVMASIIKSTNRMSLTKDFDQIVAVRKKILSHTGELRKYKASLYLPFSQYVFETGKSPDLIDLQLLARDGTGSTTIFNPFLYDSYFVSKGADLSKSSKGVPQEIKIKAYKTVELSDMSEAREIETELTIRLSPDLISYK